MHEPDPEDGALSESRRQSLTDRLRKLLKDADPEITLDEHDPGPAGHSDGPPSDSASEIVRRLKAHGLKQTRYRVKGEIARGGMGVILHVWDEDLRRDLAMKVVLGRKPTQELITAEEVPPKILGRFLEEAQITGQLDHPAIVPVHELSIDESGHVYFTMRLVKGRDLKWIFDLVAQGAPGWSITRALGVLHKMCEAVAFAHAKGVIHRDLKPANVMVGRFGEVYVMDWGLARVLGREDRHDIRLNVDHTSLLSLSLVDSERRTEDTGTELHTMDGDVVGTPSYMSPEQARGKQGELGFTTDIYSAGAMLYHLLGGHPPYVPRDGVATAQLVLLRLLEAPPAPLQETRKDLPPELVAICEKAMAREVPDRYATMVELADDLRAFLEQRVVKAYSTGPAAELRKWMLRNKAAAAGLVVALVSVIGGLTWSRLAEASMGREREANSAYYRAFTTRAEAVEQWPARPEMIALMAEWLQQANELVSERAEYEQRLLRLEASAGDTPPTELGLQLERQRQLLAILDELDPANPGSVARTVSERLDFARSVEEATVSGPAAALRWDDAIAAIARSPAYGGLVIEPQLGLIPLGADPDSGLWEFAHLETGSPAKRGPDERFALTAENGIVLILIPGGEFLMGAQNQDSKAEHYYERASAEEGPPVRVQVDPFFISKYEMTQAQWLRAMGANPSTNRPDNEERVPITLQHPVETVNWHTCQAAMFRLGLSLPTEAQWEYAARAGTDTLWWVGDDLAAIEGKANVADETLAEFHGASHEIWRDGYFLHAPAGSQAANPWGLHEVIGNVREWTREWRGATTPQEQGARGSSFWMRAHLGRSSARAPLNPGVMTPGIGVRPARGLVRKDTR